MKNFLLKSSLSILIGGLFSWLALRNVVWADLTTAFASGDLCSIGGYFPLFTACLLVRAAPGTIVVERGLDALCSVILLHGIQGCHQLLFGVACFFSPHISFRQLRGTFSGLQA